MFSFSRWSFDGKNVDDGEEEDNGKVEDGWTIQYVEGNCIVSFVVRLGLYGI